MLMSFLFSYAIILFQSLLTVNFGQISAVYFIFSAISVYLGSAFTRQYQHSIQRI